MRDLALYVTIVINVMAMFGMIAGILMHSGRGGGLSDMFGGGMSSNLGSSGVAERNLNRFTVILGITWGVVIIGLGLIMSYS